MRVGYHGFVPPFSFSYENNDVLDLESALPFMREKYQGVDGFFTSKTLLGLSLDRLAFHHCHS